MLQTPQQLWCPPLDILQPLNVVSVVASRVYRGWPHFMPFAFSAAWTHAVNQRPRLLSYLTAFQPLRPRSVALLLPKCGTRMFRPGTKGEERKSHGAWERNQRGPDRGGRRGDRRPPHGRRNPGDGAGRQPAPFRRGLPPSRRYPGNGAAGATRSPGPAAGW